MKHDIEEQAGALVLRLQGRFDAASAPEIKQLLKDQVGAGNTRIVLEISGVDFMDSSGLSVIVTCQRLAQSRGGDLRIAGAAESVKSILELTRLSRVFELDSDVGEAISRLPPKSRKSGR